MDSDLAPEGEPSPVAGILRRSQFALRDGTGKLTLGAALLLCAAARKSGERLGGAALGEAARILDLAPSRVHQIAEFCDELASGDNVTVCHGVSCTVRGAAALHASLARLGITSDPVRPWSRVTCLDHCDRGPSIMAGNRIFCAGTQEIDEDRRTWRQGSGIPAPVSGADRTSRER